MNRFDPSKAIAVLANIGVIAGIVFLGVEISQNTRALEMGAYQQLISQLDQLATLNRQNPEANDLSATSWQELSREEAAERFGRFSMVVRLGDLAFYQFQQGMLSEERLESVMGPLDARACDPLFVEWWKGFSQNLVLSYREYVNAKLASGEC